MPVLSSFSEGVHRDMNSMYGASMLLVQSQIIAPQKTRLQTTTFEYIENLSRWSVGRLACVASMRT